jgi:hypothetical protein
MNCYNFADLFRQWTARTGQPWWREKLSRMNCYNLLIISGCGQHIRTVLVERKLCCLNRSNFADYFRLWTAHTGQRWWRESFFLESFQFC